MITIAEILCFFVLPVLVVKFYKGNERYRGAMFSVVILIGVVLAYVYGLTLIDIGIRIDNIIPALYVYIPSGIIILLAIILYANLFHFKPWIAWRTDPLFLPLAFLLGAGQQFLYQGVLLQILLRSYSVPAAIIITSLLFGFLHIIFPRPVLSFISTSFLGVVFAALFIYAPNLFIASLVHFILNAVGVALGTMVITDETGEYKRAI